MSKQDRTYSRTPEDLERKYNLGQLAQGGSSQGGGDNGKISQALQEIANCKATINTMLAKIKEIESEIGEGGGSGDVRYIKQVEYDALPDSKYTDDIEYRITDAGINGVSASNVKYDNSATGLDATTTQQAIDKLNESLESFGYNDFSIIGEDKVDLLKYSADNPYTTPCIGFIRINGNGSVFIRFNNSGVYGYGTILSNETSINSLFLPKGVKIYATTNGNGFIDFLKLSGV